MKVELRKLSIADGLDIYEMLQEIPNDENGFINPIKGNTFEYYKLWLAKSDELSHSHRAMGWKVPTSIYWLYIEGYPVGYGKLRHFLTEDLREEGGHIGYTIRPSQRNKGYGTILLSMIVQEARKKKIGKLLITIRNSNIGSIKVALKNNGKIERITNERHYIWI